MQSEPVITFHNLPHSDGLEALIRTRIAKLEQLSRRITSCRVAIEAVSRSAAGAERFEVTLDLALPGQSVIARSEPHTEAQAAVNEVFDVGRRKLIEQRDRKR
ncbi:MAG: HPF/RaiA family ribosome-associated protein [Geminicoccaceae bacterium]